MNTILVLFSSDFGLSRIILGVKIRPIELKINILVGWQNIEDEIDFRVIR